MDPQQSSVTRDTYHSRLITVFLIVFISRIFTGMLQTNVVPDLWNILHNRLEYEENEPISLSVEKWEKVSRIVCLPCICDDIDWHQSLL